MIIKKITKEDDLYLIDLSQAKFYCLELTLIKFNLYVGKDISDIDEIINYNKYELAYKEALEFLKKPKTEKEVYDFLNDYKEEIINRLKENYLLNDEMYAINYKIKQENKHIGKNNIIRDLYKLGIKSDIIDNLVFDREIENINYYINQVKNEPYLKKYNKLRLKLIEKGFDESDYINLINLDNLDSLLIKDDILKALKKYEKYQGYEKKQRVIRYLLQKGYDFEVINSNLTL